MTNCIIFCRLHADGFRFSLASLTTSCVASDGNTCSMTGPLVPFVKAAYCSGVRVMTWVTSCSSSFSSSECVDGKRVGRQETACTRDAEDVRGEDDDGNDDNEDTNDDDDDDDGAVVEENAGSGIGGGGRGGGGGNAMGGGG